MKCVMKFIISDTLTTKLNMSRRNNKRAFGPTNLLETVYSKYFFHISLSIYLSFYLSLKSTLTQGSINCDLIK